MKAFLRIATFFYFSLLIYIFFLARRRPHPSLESGHRNLHLKLFNYKYQFFRYYFFSSPLRDQWKFYTDFFGNIFLFIPFAFIFSVVFNIKSPGKIILICFFTSLSVEITQYILNIGVADVDDLALNTLGGCIGVLLLKYLQHIQNPFFNKFLYPDNPLNR